MNEGPIVVGFDGSPDARTAVRWAVDAAVRHGARLRLVYAVGEALRSMPGMPMPWAGTGEADRQHAEKAVQEVVAELSAGVPAVEVTGEVVEGNATAVLCALSAHSRMLVIGSRGLGGFAGLFAGSVSVAVAAHATCPVVVVRDGDPSTSQRRPVMVGVDDAPLVQDAVGFAFEEAALRGVHLVAVRAWNPPGQPWHRDVRPLVLDIDELETAERHVARAIMADWQAKYPNVRAEVRLVAADARRALAAASHDAQLIVVGHRGRGGFVGLTLGSVSQYLLQHAWCPVAVVRPSGHRSAGVVGAVE